MSQILLRKETSNHLIKLVSGLLLLLTLIPGLAQCEYTEDGRFYPNPGIVAYRGGKWVGSDHLYNITDSIDVVVEIFKPEKTVIPVTEGMIRARVADIFKKAKIQPAAQNVPGKPLLPFFHLLLMIYPIDKGFVAYTEGRLFEQVTIDRVRLDEQTAMQAITWESENLILSPSNDLQNQIYKSVDEITNTFVDRYLFYQNIKSQIQKR